MTHSTITVAGIPYKFHSKLDNVVVVSSKQGKKK